MCSKTWWRWGGGVFEDLVAGGSEHNGRTKRVVAAQQKSGRRPAAMGLDAMELARELEEQNAELVEVLRDKERELQALRPLAAAARESSPAGGPSAAHAKVAELARKNRSASLAHERERRRADAATAEVRACADFMTPLGEHM